MDDRKGWRERVMDIRADSATSRGYIYIYIYIYIIEKRKSVSVLCYKFNSFVLDGLFRQNYRKNHFLLTINCEEYVHLM